MCVIIFYCGKFGGKYYHQTQGIPQGSILSALLCKYVLVKPLYFHNYLLLKMVSYFTLCIVITMLQWKDSIFQGWMHQKV